MNEIQKALERIDVWVPEIDQVHIVLPAILVRQLDEDVINVSRETAEELRFRLELALTVNGWPANDKR